MGILYHSFHTDTQNITNFSLTIPLKLAELTAFKEKGTQYDILKTLFGKAFELTGEAEETVGVSVGRQLVKLHRRREMDLSKGL